MQGSFYWQSPLIACRLISLFPGWKIFVEAMLGQRNTRLPDDRRLELRQQAQAEGVYRPPPQLYEQICTLMDLSS